MKLSICSIFLIMAIVRMRGVEGHGRLLEPPSRSSMWRYKRTDPALTPYADIIQDNYDDNGLNCGGKQTQIDNGGKCGICGDSYTAAVKENEAGGKYALGIITRNYRPGSTIAAEVEITAEHKGYFEFRLCPWNNVGLPVTQECLDQRLLSFADGQTKWYLPEQPELAKGVHELRIQLPSDVTCDQCLLQWRYRTGNSWGYEDSKQGLGLGQQEEFYGCSDVAIKGDLPSPSTLVPTSISTSPSSSTEGPATNIAETTTTAKPTSSSSFAPPTTSAEIETEVPTLATPPDCSQVAPGKLFFRDCTSFYICAHAFLPPYYLPCPQGTVFSKASGLCDHPYLVDAPCGYL